MADVIPAGEPRRSGSSRTCSSLVNEIRGCIRVHGSIVLETDFKRAEQRQRVPEPHKLPAGPHRFLDPVWSKISNALKRLGFRSHNFLAQLLSETARACTIRVRRSTLGRLWNDLGSHAGLPHRNRRPGTSTEKRISGRREPDPEGPNPRPVVVMRCRKSYVGGDRPPARTESLGRIGGGRETGYAAGLVPKAHRQPIRRIEVSQIPGSSQS